MKEKLLMYIALLWLIGILLSTFMAGGQFGSDDTEVMNQLMVMRVAKVGTWSVPVPNSEFFTHGISNLFAWDYSFLSGSYLLPFLYLFNVALAFVFLAIFVGVVYNVFS